MDVQNLEEELYYLCMDIINILHNLKTNDKISQEEYNSHMEQKIKYINYYLSSKQG